MVGVALPDSAIPVRCDWQRGSVELIDVSDSIAARQATSIWIDTTRFAHGGRWTSTVSALELLMGREQTPLPAGLVFHTGRCGSTLLANVLAAFPGLRVLSEPNVLSQLLLHQELGGSGHLIRLLFAAFSRGAGRGAVVKTSNWHVIAARHILTSLPGVPAVFVWRPATDVVASCLHQPPPWSGWGDLRALLARQVPQLEGTDDPGPASAEFFARVWNVTMRAGLDLVYAHRDQASVLAYDDLCTDPAAVGAQVAERFGLSGADALAGAMARAAGRYSKDPAGKTAFDPRGAHARPTLGSPEHALVTRLTAPLEEEIKSLPRGLRVSADPGRAGP